MANLPKKSTVGLFIATSRFLQNLNSPIPSSFRYSLKRDIWVLRMARCLIWAAPGVCDTPVQLALSHWKQEASVFSNEMEPRLFWDSKATTSRSSREKSIRMTDRQSKSSRMIRIYLPGIHIRSQEMLSINSRRRPFLIFSTCPPSQTG